MTVDIIWTGEMEKKRETKKKQSSFFLVLFFFFFFVLTFKLLSVDLVLRDTVGFLQEVLEFRIQTCAAEGVLEPLQIQWTVQDRIHSPIRVPGILLQTGLRHRGCEIVEQRCQFLLRSFLLCIRETALRSSEGGCLGMRCDCVLDRRCGFHSLPQEITQELQALLSEETQRCD